jgi:mRNA interferase MazF
MTKEKISKKQSHPKVESTEIIKCQKGDVILVDLPKNSDEHSEIYKTRPCLVLFNSGKKSKHSLILIAPLTSQIDKKVMNLPEIYPILAKEVMQTKENSVVLLDQIRAVDTRKIKRKISSIHPIYLNVIIERIKEMFDMGYIYDPLNPWNDLFDDNQAFHQEPFDLDNPSENPKDDFKESPHE